MSKFENYPLPAYNYRVDVDGATISFSEVSGLKVEYENLSFWDSSIQDSTNFDGPKFYVIPSRSNEITITMKKGYIRGEEVGKQKDIFYNWINGINKTMEKKDITVTLCDMNGHEINVWTVKKAFPTKLEIPNFSADANEVAVETMELIADGLSQL